MMMISCMLNVQVDDGSCIVDLASVLRSSCLCCLLSILGEIRECPWHCTMSEDTRHHYTVAHLIGVDGGNGKANVIGYNWVLTVTYSSDFDSHHSGDKVGRMSCQDGPSLCPLFDLLSSP